jgi:hypothetical protein
VISTTDFAKFVFPVIQRSVWSSPSMTKIVKIQPMSAPSGGIFYMDYAYGEHETYTAPCVPRPGSTVVGTSVNSERRVTYVVVNIDVDDVTLAGGNCVKRVPSVDIKVNA